VSRTHAARFLAVGTLDAPWAFDRPTGAAACSDGQNTSCAKRAPAARACPGCDSIGVPTWLGTQCAALICGDETQAADYTAETLTTPLTGEQVENSPPLERDLPVSRQKEIDLAEYYDYYGQPKYWTGTGHTV